MSMPNKPHKQKSLNKADIRNLQHNVAVLVMERKQNNDRINELEYKVLELTQELIDIRKAEAGENTAKDNPVAEVAPLT